MVPPLFVEQSQKKGVIKNMTSREETRANERVNVLRNHLQSSSLSPSVTSASNTSATFKELVYVKKTNKYREATRIRTQSLDELRRKVQMSKGMLLVKNIYAGVQASVSEEDQSAV